VVRYTDGTQKSQKALVQEGNTWEPSLLSLMRFWTSLPTQACCVQFRFLCKSLLNISFKLSCKINGINLVISYWDFFYFWLVELNSFWLILFSFNLSRLDEQLYLERCSILRPPFFPTIPPSYMYMRYPQDMLPSPVGLISPVMHERWAYICIYAIMKIAFR